MSEQNWEKKIEEIEAEIFDSPSADNSPANTIISSVKNWFLALPNVGKSIVAVLAVMVILSLLNTVFSLLKLLLSIGVLGGIVYLVYQLVNKNND